MIRILSLAAAILAVPVVAACAPAVPRAAEGHPDLSGVWTNASATHLTRPPGETRTALTRLEAEAYAKSNAMVRRLDADAAPSDAEAGAPSPGDPGGYNGFWLDPGRTLGEVNGEYRTAWITVPVDGQLPLSEAGKRHAREAAAHARAADAPAGPERLEPWDRSLISSRGSGGPGMLNNINNSH